MKILSSVIGGALAVPILFGFRVYMGQPASEALFSAACSGLIGAVTAMLIQMFWSKP